MGLKTGWGVRKKNKADAPLYNDRDRRGRGRRELRERYEPLK